MLALGEKDWVFHDGECPGLELRSCYYYYAYEYYCSCFFSSSQ